MRVLATGGAGYVGSHCVLELLKAGHEVVSLDDYSNSSEEALRRAAELAGREATAVRGDVRDRPLLERLLRGRGIEAVVHFAGLKSVGESAADPLRYYDVNVGGSAALLSAMRAAGCRSLVFSSSATVYGAPEANPITEEHPLSALNPYGRTKLVVEDMCRDLAASEPGWRVALLRYFNPVGAHESGRLGEDPRGVPNNLMPYVMQVAVGRLPHVNVLGTDYPTLDGTGVRDYIHVVDLALAHRAALERLERLGGARALNLGTGRGHSVREVLAAAQRAVGRPIPSKDAPRRAGDAPACWADPSRAREALGWAPKRDLDAMCADHWRWQSRNPEGYGA